MVSEDLQAISKKEAAKKEWIMNILYVNTNFHEGGAAKVARQLFYGMKEKGHNVYFLAGYPSKGDGECMIMNPAYADRFFNLVTGILQNNQVLSRRKARRQILDIVREKRIDVIHFHNLFENYIGIRDVAYIAARCKVVWTLHDMWAVTGHCAFSLSCNEWKRGCPACKERRLYPAFYYNDVKQKYQWKKESFTGNNITFVTPSHWMEKVCRDSYLRNEKIIVIPNGVNSEIYKPLKKDALRKKYKIPEDKAVLFFTAAVVADARKGVLSLIKALEMIDNKEKYCLLIAGNGEMHQQLDGYHICHMGYISDEKKMNELYNLADLYINPSLQESFGYTSVESAAAGTPVIVFENSALEEVVNEQMGQTVATGDCHALCKAIEAMAEDKVKLEKIGKTARERALQFYGENRMLDDYEKLYRQLLE